MKITCEYCGGYLQDTDECCPHCAAVNKNVMRSADGIPKTIAQLKAFAEEKNLPLKQMRFFVGENVKEPRAFGIYKDEFENYVVYKNKSDGTRIVRYEGKDEAYAVNELYQKMRSEVMEQKAHKAVDFVHGKKTSTSQTNQAERINQWKEDYQNYTQREYSSSGMQERRRRKNKATLVKTIIFIIMLILLFSRMRNGIVNRILSSVVGGYSGGYESDYDDYDYGDYDYGDYDYDDYDDYDSWGDDWDDDDWDFGGDSWDSGYTDWDTDW